MSDYFKTLRGPLIEQQEKTDGKQDKVIEQLKENQLAITDGIQDIMTLDKELPQLAIEEEKEKKDIFLKIDNYFNDKDKEIIGRYGLVQPKDLLKNDNDYLNEYYSIVKEKRNEISDKIGGLKSKKQKMFLLK